METKQEIQEFANLLRSGVDLSSEIKDQLLGRAASVVEHLKLLMDDARIEVCILKSGTPKPSTFIHADAVKEADKRSWDCMTVNPVDSTPESEEEIPLEQ